MEKGERIRVYNMNENAWKRCKEIILEDTKIKEIDAVFYDLLDAVESDVATKLEDAYLESGARAVELAYLQRIKDGNEEKIE